VREKAEEWMIDYNYNRPHKVLNYKTTMDLLQQIVNL
jgi:putative transposase